MRFEIEMVQHTREVDVQVLRNRQPVGNELQGNNVQQALEHIDRLRDLNLLASLVCESLIVLVANYNRTTAAGNNYDLSADEH